MVTQSQIDPALLESAASLMRALSHPLRLKLLEFISTNQPVNVNKIYKTLNLEQSITSQHLAILRKNGLVETSKEGKFVYYSVHHDKLERINALLHNFFED